MYQGSQKQTPQPAEEEKKDPSLSEKTAQTLRDSSKAVYQNVSGVFNRSQPTKNQQRYSATFLNEIRKRLDSYFGITVRNVRDSIPKAVGFYLVRSVQDKLQFELLSSLNHKDKLAELLGEPPHIMEERRTLHNQLQVLQKAIGVLTRDPTIMAIASEADDMDFEEPVVGANPAT